MTKRFTRMAAIAPLAFAAVLITVLAGCKTRVGFSEVGPRASPYRINDDLLVSLPDDIQDRTVKVKMGKLWEAHVFTVPVGDAYITESKSRMRGLFTGKVSVTTHSFLTDYLNQDPSLGVATDPMEERGVEDVMKDLSRKESGTKEERKDIKKTEQELVIEGLRKGVIEEMQNTDFDYILSFDEAQMGFLDQRAVIVFKVTLVDFRTRNIIMQKRYTGKSHRLTANRNMKTNEIALQQMVREALSIGMVPLVNDIAKVTGAS